MEEEKPRSVSVRYIGHGSEGNTNIIVFPSMLLNDGHLPPVPKLRMCGATPLLPMYAFVTCTVTLHFFPFYLINCQYY